MSEDQIVAGVVCAVVGLVIGYLFGGRMAPGSQQSRELEDKLRDATRSRELFEQRVNMHFSDTASKLNALTENYREVYEHLASGAADLCSSADSKTSFDALTARPAASDDTDAPAIESDSVVVEAPRDYAPKTSPDDPGVLNERFGLEGEDRTPEEESKRSD